MARVTIYDIARELGISASTVSRALNGKQGVAPELRDRILKTRSEKGYAPNLLARSLAGGNANIVGVLLPQILQTQGQLLCYTLQPLLSQMGYQLFSLITEATDENIRTGLRILSGLNPAAVLMPDSSYQTEAVRETILDTLGGTAVFLIDGALNLPNVHSIRADYHGGMEKCVEHLRERGRKRPAYIMAGRAPADMEKLAGYMDAMAKIYPNIDPIVAEYHDTDYQHPSATRNFIREHPEADGIIYASDIESVIGYQTLIDSGKSVPGDYAILAASNSFYTDFHSPRITFLRAEIETKKNLLAEYISRLASGEAIPTDTVLETRLMVRDTT